MPRLPRLGSVVWASLQDANGFSKIHPAVVVTPTGQIRPGQTVRVAAVTTRLTGPLPDDYVLLPSKGTARSGLRCKCAAVASWLSEASVDELQVAGILPPAVIDELLQKFAALFPELASDD